MSCKKEDCVSRKEYQLIVQAWIDNQSMSDIYDMIVRWVDRHKNQDMLDLTNDIMKRACSNDSINDIVEDFIYGKKYEALRLYYTS